MVPPEYRAAGSPPASWFIDGLMNHLGQPYYVGLLSAAAIHGAAHQQPMVFQVVTSKPTRAMRAGRVAIHFSMSRRVDQLPVFDQQTETGTMRVATPETTAFDLVRYPAGAGHLSNAVLDTIGQTELTTPLAGWLAARQPRAVRLHPGEPAHGTLDRRWHVLPNVELEADV